jgi:hypothetical protein
MTEPTDRANDAALWQQWRAAIGAAAGEATRAPDALLLAAYAENRLGEAEADAVESWLATHPDAIEDVLNAQRSLGGGPSEHASDAALVRAMALVSGSDPKILPFRRPAPRQAPWRIAVARVGIAASLVAVSLIGFALGNDAYLSVLGVEAQAPVLSQDLFDPPSGLFSDFAVESST